jgi:phospho-N-acetylmuramoyl-pentapeptide-transferase
VDKDAALVLTSTIVGLITSAVLAFPIFKLLLALKSRQTISAHVPEHAAKQGTPTMGGLFIVAGFLASCGFLWVRLDGEMRLGAAAVVVVWLGFAIIGFVDDFVVPRLMKGKRGLGWTQKLVMQIIVASAAALLVQSTIVSTDTVILVFLILFFSNAYNFADGLDWLAGTLLLAFLAGLIALIGPYNPVLLAYCFSLAGATLPFIVLNRPPARVFMGDVGALPIGAFMGLAVGVVALGGTRMVVWESGFGWTIPVALLLLSVVMIGELVPVPLQILSVKLRKGQRLFPKTPIHHAFQVAGWTEAKIVCLFALIQVLGSLGAYGLVRWGNEAHRPLIIQHPATESGPGWSEIAE